MLILDSYNYSIHKLLKKDAGSMSYAGIKVGEGSQELISLKLFIVPLNQILMNIHSDNFYKCLFPEKKISTINYNPQVPLLVTV